LATSAKPERIALGIIFKWENILQFMITKENLEILKRQHYAIAGKNSAVKVCEWTKHSLRGEGVCYKEKFYGIKSSGCCEMSPSAVWCDNKCLHCWRAIEHTQGNKMDKKLVDSPETIIEECIKGRKKLLTGFKGNDKVNKKKLQESQIPTHFAISLIGEPLLYPYIGELIKEVRNRNRTSFIVSNGLHPEVIQEMAKKKQLPTQLYISLNAYDRDSYEKWHNSTRKDAWERFNKTLDLLKKLKKKTRTILRMTIVRHLNMHPEAIQGFAELIKKAEPLFVEVKGYISVGYARKRLGYETMPFVDDIDDFAIKLAKACGMKVLARHECSRIALLGKAENKKRMKIKKSEY